MAIGADLTLRVFGRAYYLADQYGRRRPLAEADIDLTALESTPTGFKRIVAPTNPIQVSTDGHGRFDQRTDWGTLAPGLPGTRAVVSLPEPDAFDVNVTDPSSQVIVQVGRVYSNGDNMVIEPQMAPKTEPLAQAEGRGFTDLADFARFLTAGLSAPQRLSMVTLLRVFVNEKDSFAPTAPEQLFQQFGIMLDRLQAHELEHRKHSPGFNPNNYALMVPVRPATLEAAIKKAIYWLPRLSAADRMTKLVAGYGGVAIDERFLQRVLPRLVALLGQTLGIPVHYRPAWYLWEDMAVCLTLCTAIGLVAQGNRMVWTDYVNRSDERELTLSTL